ncbi:MAG: glycosyltransferase family 39 protein, partial [Terriglobia bacterium]
MRSLARILTPFPFIFLGLLILHFPLLRLPYFWDEAGYYIPAALDFYRHGLLIPRLTLPTGHTPLVMVYLGAAWHLFGFSELTTRTAMILIAAATVVITYALGRRVARREAGIWAAILLALSPLFFAQSSLVFLDLTAALFTTLAIFFVLNGRWGMFAVAASLAVLSKETAIVMLGAVWAFMLFRRKERRVNPWALSAIPFIPLIVWAIYYHSRTGFWTGNAGYLQYNLYSAFTPLHVCRSLLARLAEVFFQGFNWLIVLAAAAGTWWARRKRRLPACSEGRGFNPAGKRAKINLSLFLWPFAAGLKPRPSSAFSRWAFEDDFGNFLFLTLALIAVYVLMLSAVGG